MNYSTAQMLSMARQYLEEAKKMENENHALWCDAGEHAFGPHTKGYERWTKEVSDPDTGYVSKQTILACPKHLTGQIPAIKGEIE